MNPGDQISIWNNGGALFIDNQAVVLTTSVSGCTAAGSVSGGKLTLTLQAGCSLTTSQSVVLKITAPLAPNPATRAYQLSYVLGSSTSGGGSGSFFVTVSPSATPGVQPTKLVATFVAPFDLPTGATVVVWAANAALFTDGQPVAVSIPNCPCLGAVSGGKLTVTIGAGCTLTANTAYDLTVTSPLQPNPTSPSYQISFAYSSSSSSSSGSFSVSTVASATAGAPPTELDVTFVAPFAMTAGGRIVFWSTTGALFRAGQTVTVSIAGCPCTGATDANGVLTVTLGTGCSLVSGSSYTLKVTSQLLVSPANASYSIQYYSGSQSSACTSGLQITPYPATAATFPTYLDATMTLTTALTAGSTIVLESGGYAAFTANTQLTVQAAGVTCPATALSDASGTQLTITLAAGCSLAAGQVVTWRISGGLQQNPPLGYPVSWTITFHTSSQVQATTSVSSTGSLSVIAIPSTVGSTPTELDVTFTAPFAMTTGDTITFWGTTSPLFQAGQTVTVQISGCPATAHTDNNGVLTVTLSTNCHLVSGQSYTLQILSGLLANVAGQSYSIRFYSASQSSSYTLGFSVVASPATASVTPSYLDVRVTVPWAMTAGSTIVLQATNAVVFTSSTAITVTAQNGVTCPATAVSDATGSVLTISLLAGCSLTAGQAVTFRVSTGLLPNPSYAVTWKVYFFMESSSSSTTTTTSSGSLYVVANPSTVGSTPTELDVTFTAPFAMTTGDTITFWGTTSPLFQAGQTVTVQISGCPATAHTDNNGVLTVTLSTNCHLVSGQSYTLQILSGLLANVAGQSYSIRFYSASQSSTCTSGLSVITGSTSVGVTITVPTTLTAGSTFVLQSTSVQVFQTNTQVTIVAQNGLTCPAMAVTDATGMSVSITLLAGCTLTAGQTYSFTITSGVQTTTQTGYTISWIVNYYSSTTSQVVTRVDCQVSGWGSWSTCSVSCNGGTKSRQQAILQPPIGTGLPCPATLETAVCSTSACPSPSPSPIPVVNCVMSDWLAWTTCSKTCSGGTQTHSRTIITQPSNGGAACGATIESQQCNTQPCPINCQFTEWLGWSTCTASCNGGTSTRSRTVTVQAAYGGTACPTALTEVVNCNTQPCPVDCVMSGWTAWTTCTKSCGGGTMSHSRSIITAPQNGGAPCPGTLEVQTCGTQACVVDCVVGAWLGWSSCSASCGGGIRTQSRAITTYPANGGAGCLPTQTSESCNTQSCPVNCVWGSWGLWSQCSQTCGGGSMTRTRAVAVSAQNGGTPCEGPTLETLPCVNQPCRVDCVVGAWSAWEACSVTCGGGSQIRSRSPVTLPVNGGLGCPTLTESQPCNTEACSDKPWFKWSPSPTPAPESTIQVICTVDEWGDWDACSLSCGGGSHIRRRAIIEDAVNGGEGCPPTEESEACNTDLCPVDCVMGEWKGWSSCTQSCGGGSQVNTRDVLIQPENGGAACLSTQDSRACNTQACTVDCVVQAWSEWSRCSVDCGGGSRTQTRAIAVLPQNGGLACPATEQTEGCNAVPCAPQCTYGGWSAWSGCSKSCGAGVQTRVRAVAAPPSYGAPLLCDELEETQVCNVMDCPPGGTCDDATLYYSEYLRVTSGPSPVCTLEQVIGLLYEYQCHVLSGDCNTLLCDGPLPPLAIELLNNCTTPEYQEYQ